MNVALSSMALILASALPASAWDESCKKCGQTTFGTSLEWAGSPSDAAKKALKEKKLVFVLHVSGRFEEAKFT